jgi:hypothetical protein
MCCSTLPSRCAVELAELADVPAGYGQEARVGCLLAGNFTVTRKVRYSGLFYGE